MKCPQCHKSNQPGATECSDCGVLFRDTRRAAVAKAGPAMCAWTDYGRSCPCRGILSHGTSGEGAWYCREHWERINNREPYGVGNQLPPSSGAGFGAKRWDGWHAKWLERRNRRQLPEPLAERVPGDDDDLSDLVPVEAGQG